MAIDLQGRQQRGNRDIKGLQMFGAKAEAEKHIVFVREALNTCQALVGERNQLAKEIVPLRRNTAVIVNHAVDLVDSQIKLIREMEGDRYATIATIVEVPGFDKLEFGKSLPRLFAGDERMEASVAAVARRCIPAVEARTTLATKEARLTELDHKVEVAERAVKHTQEVAETYVLDNTHPGHPAREAIRQPRAKKASESTSANDVPTPHTVQADTTTESPANASTPATAPKAA